MHTQNPGEGMELDEPRTTDSHERALDEDSPDLEDLGRKVPSLTTSLGRPPLVTKHARTLHTLTAAESPRVLENFIPLWLLQETLCISEFNTETSNALKQTLAGTINQSIKFYYCVTSITYRQLKRVYETLPKKLKN